MEMKTRSDANAHALRVGVAFFVYTTSTLTANVLSGISRPARADHRTPQHKCTSRFAEFPCSWPMAGETLQLALRRAFKTPGFKAGCYARSKHPASKRGVTHALVQNALLGAFIMRHFRENVRNALLGAFIMRDFFVPNAQRVQNARLRSGLFWPNTEVGYFDACFTARAPNIRVF